MIHVTASRELIVTFSIVGSDIKQSNKIMLAFKIISSLQKTIKMSVPLMG